MSGLRWTTRAYLLAALLITAPTLYLCFWIGETYVNH